MVRGRTLGDSQLHYSSNYLDVGDGGDNGNGDPSGDTSTSTFNSLGVVAFEADVAEMYTRWPAFNIQDCVNDVAVANCLDR